MAVARAAVIKLEDEKPAVRTLFPPVEREKRREEVNARLTELLALLMSSPEYQLT